MKFGFDPVDKKASGLAGDPTMKVYNCCGENRFHAPFNPFFYDTKNTNVYTDNYENTTGDCHSNCSTCYRHQANAYENSSTAEGTCYRQQANTYENASNEGQNCYRDVENIAAPYCGSCQQYASSQELEPLYYYNEVQPALRSLRAQQTVDRQRQKLAAEINSNKLFMQRDLYYRNRLNT